MQNQLNEHMPLLAAAPAQQPAVPAPIQIVVQGAPAQQAQGLGLDPAPNISLCTLFFRRDCSALGMSVGVSICLLFAALGANTENKALSIMYYTFGLVGVGLFIASLIRFSGIEQCIRGRNPAAPGVIAYAAPAAGAPEPIAAAPAVAPVQHNGAALGLNDVLINVNPVVQGLGFPRFI